MRLLRWTLGILAALVLAGAVATVFLPNLPLMVLVTALNLLRTTDFRVEGDSLYMSGLINNRTLDAFETVMAEHPEITRIVQLNMGGSLDDETMIALAYKIRERGLNTHLTATSVIESGAVDLFLSGVQRSMEPGAQIGVHSWRDETGDGAAYPRNSPLHEANRKYVEDMLGRDDFYWFTLAAAPGDGMHFMTPEEIAAMGLINTPSGG